jgi:mono/diheme cytochrome c family protein
LKKIVKAFGVLLVILVLTAAGGAVYVESTYLRDFSSVPLPSIQASTDPEVIARGEYLVHAVAHCSACHSSVEKMKDRKLDQTELTGGYVIEAGPFGSFIPTNITSDPETGIGSVSDGLVARAIRHGVDRNGRYAPFMGLAVGDMSDEDLTAAVSYLRTLPPKKHATKADEWGPIAKLLTKSFNPRVDPRLEHVASGTTSLARGEYLANGPALCSGCHTQTDPMNGFAVVGAKFSGEPAAEPDPMDPAFEFVVPNLTPDPETGVMAAWSEEFFIQRFRTGRLLKGSKMPWDNFQKMTDEDLKSLYRYLRTLAPVKKFIGPSRRPAGSSPT